MSRSQVLDLNYDVNMNIQIEDLLFGLDPNASRIPHHPSSSSRKARTGDAPPSKEMKFNLPQDEQVPNHLLKYFDKSSKDAYRAMMALSDPQHLN